MNNNEYQALHNGAAFQLRPTGGVLELSDNDRVDFLQRMTTNNIAALKPGQSTVTVLPNPMARVLFAFTVVAQDETLLCLPAVGQTETLSKHLRGQIFFMDKVKVADLSAELARLRLMGPEAASTLSSAGLVEGDPAEIADGTLLQGDGVTAIKQMQYDVPGFELLVATEEQDGLIEKLTAAGAIQLSDDEAYTTRRVELGRPKVSHELIDTYTPLESGLAWTCAEDKGCYTGQEIIARQITYDKVTKVLAAITSDAQLTEGDDVLVDGRSMGKVTSVAHSPTLGRYMALAVLKKPHNQSGINVSIGDADAVTEALPLVA